jgi:hypothetical protein
MGSYLPPGRARAEQPIESCRIKHPDDLPDTAGQSQGSPASAQALLAVPGSPSVNAVDENGNQDAQDRDRKHREREILVNHDALPSSTSP